MRAVLYEQFGHLPELVTVPDPATMILFLDAGLVYPGDWHGNLNGNILLCDGHVAFGKIPTAGMRSDFRW